MVVSIGKMVHYLPEMARMFPGTHTGSKRTVDGGGVFSLLDINCCLQKNIVVIRLQPILLLTTKQAAVF